MNLTNMKKNLYTIQEFKDIITKHKSRNDKIVMCNGCFDLLHIGHIKHLEESKEKGDILVVLLTNDKYVRKQKGPDRPVFNERLRAEALLALECVDYVVLNDNDIPYQAIKTLQPDIFSKGLDWKLREDKENLDKCAIESIGGKMLYTTSQLHSSSNLFYNYSDIIPEKTKEFLSSFEYEYEDIVSYIDEISKLKILVIGEFIKDEYIHCESIGKSDKSPMIVVKQLKKELFNGGTYAVSEHLKTFSNVNFITSPRYIKITKYLEGNRKLFEVYSINYLDLTEEEENKIINQLDDNIDGYDIVIIIDYGFGLITKNIRELLIKGAQYLIVNTQANAGNRGYHSIKKYNKRKDNISFCINKNEFRIATYDKYDIHNDIEDAIKQEFGNNRSIITSGIDGCIVYNNDITVIPPFTRNIVDSIGAGDALISIAGPLIYLNAPSKIVGLVGNAVGSMAVRYVGNSEYIDKISLLRYIEAILK